jgi:LCP family protein required for cell wall assembly
MLVSGIAMASVLVLAFVGLSAADLFVRQRYDANIERFDDPFVAIPEAQRPAPDPRGAVNFLLIGSDSRSSDDGGDSWRKGGQRADTIMIVHLPADGTAAYVMSIPRDAWVTVPGKWDMKINGAYSWGGPSLLVETIEELTQLRIDHVAIVDFDGFVAMTDALGGVEITVPKATRDSKNYFPAGTYVMDGKQALGYVRQRHGLDGGDFGRVQRQQNWIRSVLSTAVSRDTLTDPLKLDAFLRATTSNISVDRSLDLATIRDLALSMRGMREDDVTFFTVPVKGLGTSEDGQSIVELDPVADEALWQAIRDDTLDEWLTTSQAEVLGQTVK